MTAVKRTAVYRLSDTRGRLLYVGIATDPLRRWAQHARDKTWWSEVSATTVEWHDSRPLAERAEIIAIRSEHPMYNTQHATDSLRGDEDRELGAALFDIIHSDDKPGALIGYLADPQTSERVRKILAAAYGLAAIKATEMRKGPVR